MGDMDVVCVHFLPRCSIWWFNGHIVARRIVESLVQVYLEFRQYNYHKRINRTSDTKLGYVKQVIEHTSVTRDVHADVVK